MREKFKEQLEKNKIVTEESLLEMKSKTYHNGDAIKVGDKILFGMVIEKNATGPTDVHMIMINENQIDLYEPDERQVGTAFIPAIKLK
jgi:hypothetical protein